MLDLDPPIEVLAVLLKERKTQVKERAYVDELLS
jgi:DNA polymerase delta subunit 4